LAQLTKEKRKTIFLIKKEKERDWNDKMLSSKNVDKNTSTKGNCIIKLKKTQNGSETNIAIL
jgi:hypothetical protein